MHGDHGRKIPHVSLGDLFVTSCLATNWKTGFMVIRMKSKATRCKSTFMDCAKNWASNSF